MTIASLQRSGTSVGAGLLAACLLCSNLLANTDETAPQEASASSGAEIEENKPTRAVSAANAKASLRSGSIDGDSHNLVDFSGAFPLGGPIGLQLDGLTGSVDGESVVGYGGQVFWRQPQSALIGIVASNVELTDIKVQRTGLLAELYFKRISLDGQAGKQGGDVEDASYSKLGLTLYASDNLALRLDGSKVDDDSLGGLSIEYQTPLSGLVLFARGESGSDSADTASAGLRYYFGPDKSLKRRHREDDPRNPLYTMLTGAYPAILEARRQQAIEDVGNALDDLLDLLPDLGLDLDGIGDVLDGLDLDQLQDLTDLINTNPDGVGDALENLGLGGLGGLGGGLGG